jgi:hypothetical protein
MPKKVKTKSGESTACSPGDLSDKEIKVVTTTVKDKKLSMVPLNWKECYIPIAPSSPPLMSNRNWVGP